MSRSAGRPGDTPRRSDPAFAMMAWNGPAGASRCRGHKDSGHISCREARFTHKIDIAGLDLAENALPTGRDDRGQRGGRQVPIAALTGTDGETDLRSRQAFKPGPAHSPAAHLSGRFLQEHRRGQASRLPEHALSSKGTDRAHRRSVRALHAGCGRCEEPAQRCGSVAALALAFLIRSVDAACRKVSGVR